MHKLQLTYPISYSGKQIKQIYFKIGAIKVVSSKCNKNYIKLLLRLTKIHKFQS